MPALLLKLLLQTVMGSCCIGLFVMCSQQSQQLALYSRRLLIME
jgi:hypothetical protein